MELLDIAASMHPETTDVGLGPLERMWNGSGLDPLPEDFDCDSLGQKLRPQHSLGHEGVTPPMVKNCTLSEAMADDSSGTPLDAGMQQQVIFEQTHAGGGHGVRRAPRCLSWCGTQSV
jgi:hypothetical protein